MPRNYKVLHRRDPLNARRLLYKVLQGGTGSKANARRTQKLPGPCGPGKVRHSGLTLVLVDLLVTLLSFDAVLGGRADQQALKANGLAAVVAPAKAVFFDAL